MAEISTRADRSGHLSAKHRGSVQESKARRWLEKKGLRFIAANVRERGGEIDLVMRDSTTIVFVEVRYRQSAQYGARRPVSRATSSVSCYRRLVCGCRVIMAALLLWIAGSMWWLSRAMILSG